jgi:hypothetical protein
VATTLRHHVTHSVHNLYSPYTKNTQKNGVDLKVHKKCISHLTWTQHTLSAARTIPIPHVLPAVRLSCSLRGRGTSFQDGVTAGEGFLSAPF